MNIFIKKGWRFLLCLMMFCFSVQNTFAQSSGKTSESRKTTSLNKNWKFHLGSANNPAKDFDYGIVRNFTIAGGGGGCVVPGFKDENWRTVNVPHDWAVELPFEYHKHFDVQSHGYSDIGPKMD